MTMKAIEKSSELPLSLESQSERRGGVRQSGFKGETTHARETSVHPAWCHLISWAPLPALQLHASQPPLAQLWWAQVKHVQHLEEHGVPHLDCKGIIIFILKNCLNFLYYFLSNNLLLS